MYEITRTRVGLQYDTFGYFKVRKYSYESTNRTFVRKYFRRLLSVRVRVRVARARFGARMCVRERVQPIKTSRLSQAPPLRNRSNPCCVHTKMKSEITQRGLASQ